MPLSLKNTGLKATYPRLRILELFQKTDARHMTAEDVYRHLITEGLDIGLATVYRVLTQFEQAGIVERHFFESGKAVFELNEGKHHDHLVCLQCGKVEEFYDPEIERRQIEIAAARGFAVVNADLTLIAEAPRIGSHRDAIVAHVATLLGVAAADVNLKATTTERLGFVGRREGLAASAVVLLERRP